MNKALVNQCSSSTFLGLDSHPKQVQRFNDGAAKLLDGSNKRMFAIENDLDNPSSVLQDPQ